MTPPTRGIRAAAARLCSPHTLARLVDPILSDIEVERREAAQSGQHWRARWICVTGYVGLLKALTLHGVQACGRGLSPDEAAARTIAFSIAALVVLTTLMVLPPLLNTRPPMSIATLAVYLVPQALPLSLPVALSFGIACGWSRDATARTMLRRIMMLGVAGSLMAGATMEWLVPAANQAFRVEVMRHIDPAQVHIPRGISERSLSELWTLVKQTAPEASNGGRAGFTRDILQRNLHLRIALCFATTMLCLLAVAIANVTPRRNLARSVFAGVVLLYVGAYFFVSMAARVMPPAVSGWLPNAGLAAVALVLLSVRSPGSRAGSPGLRSST
jgi:Lipopolysaccharide export system permease LptF/LptG